MNPKTALVTDLVADIRFSGRKISGGMNVEEEIKYRDRCIKQLRDLFRERHTVIFDHYGWPKIESFRAPYGFTGD